MASKAEQIVDSSHRGDRCAIVQKRQGLLHHEIESLHVGAPVLDE